MAGKERKRGVLEGRVAGGPHVIAARDGEGLAMGQQRRQRFGRTRHLVVAADGDQDRRLDPADFRLRHRLARIDHAGGERRPVGARMLGKNAELPAGLVGNLGQGFGGKGRNDRLRIGEPGDEIELTLVPVNPGGELFATMMQYDELIKAETLASVIVTTTNNLDSAVKLGDEQIVISVVKR